MKSIPDVQVETRPSGGSGGGGGQDKVWTITGRLLVRESEIDGDSHDRPLKGIEVKVSASDIGADGPWTDWGTVRTDADGDFSLAETNNGRTRFFRVQARLNSADLEVEDGTLEDLGSLDVLDKNWRTIWKSGVQLDGPAVSVGTRVIASGGSFDLGDAIFRRSAVVWYVLRSAIDRLEAEDAWFAITPEVKAIYPAHGGFGTSWNGSEGRIYLHRGRARRLASRRGAVPVHAPVARPSHGRRAQGLRLPERLLRVRLRAVRGERADARAVGQPARAAAQPSSRRRRARPEHPRGDRALRDRRRRTRCACSGATSARAGGATCSAPPWPTRTTDPTTTATARRTTPTRSA